MIFSRYWYEIFERHIFFAKNYAPLLAHFVCTTTIIFNLCRLSRKMFSCKFLYLLFYAYFLYRKVELFRNLCMQISLNLKLQITKLYNKIVRSENFLLYKCYTRYYIDFRIFGFTYQFTRRHRSNVNVCVYVCVCHWLFSANITTYT